MIDVAELVGDLDTEAIAVRRYSPPTVDEYGDTSAAVAETASEQAVVHPSTAQVLERRPEADRTRASITLYARAPSALAPDRDAPPPQVDYGGQTFLVWSVEDYAARGGLYIAHAQLLE